MEALPRLRARIDSLEELRDLFRALRAVAASHVQEAQGALPGARQYVTVIEDAIAEGVAVLPERMAPSPEPMQAPRRLLIVICSEHGFAGAFNERLLDEAARRAEGYDIAVIGRRGLAIAGERKLSIVWSAPMATHTGGILGMTRQIAPRLGGYASVGVIFGAYRQGGGFEVTVKSLLPLDAGLLARARSRSLPLHQIAPERLLQRLADEYLFAQVTGAAMELLASENAARLQVMDRADRNIGDKLDAMHHDERRLRQEAITSELIDVVVGAEAVLEDIGSGR